MGFFADVFGDIAPALGGAIGTAVFGPVGGIIGASIGRNIGGGAVGGTAIAPVPDISRTFPSSFVSPGIFPPGGTGGIVPALSSGRGIITGMAIAFTTASEILRLMRDRGQKNVSAKKIVESARVCGIQLTAETFGISERDVCTIIVSRRRRRARGISAADMRRTRSTIRKVSTIRKDLKALAR